MMRNQNTERARIRATRPAHSRVLSQGIEDVLAHLPPRKAKKKLSPAQLLPLAAAAVLALAVAAPPIVRAAAPLIARLFSGNAQRIQEQLAQPEEARIQETADDSEAYTRSHPIDAFARVGNVTVRLEAFRLDNNATGFHRGNAVVTLAFPDAPEEFDPALVDFTLQDSSRNIPMVISESLRDYRTTGATDRDGEGWGNVFFWEDGVMRCSLYFPYDAWDTEAPTAFALTAALPGGELRMSIPYDPALAHVEALAAAEAYQPKLDADRQQHLHALESLSALAVPVGASATSAGMTFTVEELSVADGNAYFSVSLTNSGVRNAKMGSMHCSIKSLSVDGWLAPRGTDVDDVAVTNGVLTLIEGHPLPIAPDMYPETSLFTLTGEYRKELLELETATEIPLEVIEFPIAFRYNWETKVVTLPMDDAQRQAWIDEAATAKQVPGMEGNVYFTPNAKNDPNDGIVVTLEDFMFFTDGNMRVSFASDMNLPDHSSGYQITVFIDEEFIDVPISFQKHPTRSAVTFDLPTIMPYTKLGESFRVRIFLGIFGETEATAYFEETLRKLDGQLVEGLPKP